MCPVLILRMTWYNPLAIYILSSCDVKYFHCVLLFFSKMGWIVPFLFWNFSNLSIKSPTHNSKFRFTIINQLVTKIKFKTYFKVPIIWVLLFPSVIFKDKFRVLKFTARPACHVSQSAEEWRLSKPAICLGSMSPTFPQWLDQLWWWENTDSCLGIKVNL